MTYKELDKSLIKKLTQKYYTLYTDWKPEGVSKLKKVECMFKKAMTKSLILFVYNEGLKQKNDNQRN